ncbi:hypothetical protein AZSI13_12910 [Azospira sp. I13]|uniref:hypothetical protein n=1 Tax=Azospira sp. I13 TaxID=1765050 RepID=UPI000D435312|nr:hypothetical protein [Azospira sp. I13]GBG01964.1 hypothetical protein AZSI13_12910 [Azospira sp. I13]
MNTLQTSRFPAFFAEVPGITLRDPLAEFLGAAEGGRIAYRYEDAVRLAGHSCPTVAGAYLMTVRALQALYGEALPERGGVQVQLSGLADAGVTGVIASVVTLLTGAAAEGGFKGLAGRFSRRHLLEYGVDLQADARFRRLDNGRTVTARLDLSSVPADPAMGPLLQDLLSADDDTPDPAKAARFATLWQERVARVLLEHWDDPQVLQLRAD